MSLAGILAHPLGRLGLHSLPFWQMLQHPTEENVVNGVIASTAAGILVIGGIVTAALITKYRKWGVLWSEWLTSTDHTWRHLR